VVPRRSGASEKAGNSGMIGRADRRRASGLGDGLSGKNVAGEIAVVELSELGNRKIRT
jgi:hypothetical protein